MYTFSKYGIKDSAIFTAIYADFIEYCKGIAPSGMFSTYTDSEPYFASCGCEISYRNYLKIKEKSK